MIPTRRRCVSLLHTRLAFATRHFASQSPDTLDKDIDVFISSLPNSSIEDTRKRFEGLLGRLPLTSQRSDLTRRVLGAADPSACRGVTILEIALQNLGPNAMSPHVLKNTVCLIDQVTRSKRITRDLVKQLNEAFAKLLLLDPTIITTLESIVQSTAGSITTRNILVLLYLRTSSLHKAAKFVLNGNTIHSSTLELLIIHLCHHEETSWASQLIQHASRNNYKTYPRTYTTFLSAAVALGDVSSCLTNYKLIISKSYIDNGTLVGLIELLSRRISDAQMGELYGISTQKSSLTPELIARIDVAVTENIAKNGGFAAAMKFLNLNASMRPLCVDDFPELLSRFTLSKKEDKLEKTTKRLLVASRASRLQREFEVSLIMAKLAEQGRLSLAMELLRNNSVYMEYLNQDGIWQLVKGLRLSQSHEDLSALVDVLLETKLFIRRPLSVKYLIEMLIDSPFWFKLYRVFPKIKLEGKFVLYRRIAEKLEKLSEENGYGAQWEGSQRWVRKQ